MGQAYNVSGFIFLDEESAQIALKEKKAVEYLQTQVSSCSGNKLLAIYNQLIDKNMFVSSLGVDFLGELRTRLIKECGFDDNELKSLPKVKYKGEKLIKTRAPKPNPSQKASKKEQRVKVNKVKKTKLKEKKENKANKVFDNNLIIKYRATIAALGLLCSILAVCVCIMFYVVSTINSPHILNYEEILLNKYASWENELSEREAIVSLKEKNWGIER